MIIKKVTKELWRIMIETDAVLRKFLAASSVGLFMFLAGLVGLYADGTGLWQKSYPPKQEFSVVLVEGNAAYLNIDLKAYPEITKQTRLTFNGKDIGFGQLGEVKIIFKNRSERIINKESFDRPIKIHFDGQIQSPETQIIMYPRIYSASNQYLRENISLDLSDKSVVSIMPVIMEPHDWFIVSMLVLNPLYPYSTITASGKIAGFDSLSKYRKNSIYDDDFQSTKLHNSFWFDQFSRVLKTAPPFLITFSLALAAYGFILFNRRSTAQAMAQFILGKHGNWRIMSKYYLEFGIEFFACASLILRGEHSGRSLKMLHLSQVIIIDNETVSKKINSIRLVRRIKHILNILYLLHIDKDSDIVNNGEDYRTPVLKMIAHLEHIHDGPQFSVCLDNIKRISEFVVDLSGSGANVVPSSLIAHPPDPTHTAYSDSSSEVHSADDNLSVRTDTVRPKEGK